MLCPGKRCGECIEITERAAGKTDRSEKISGADFFRWRTGVEMGAGGTDAGIYRYRSPLVRYTSIVGRSGREDDDRKITGAGWQDLPAHQRTFDHPNSGICDAISSGLETKPINGFILIL